MDDNVMKKIQEELLLEERSESWKIIDFLLFSLSLSLIFDSSNQKSGMIRFSNVIVPYFILLILRLAS